MDKHSRPVASGTITVEVELTEAEFEHVDSMIWEPPVALRKIVQAHMAQMRL
jgi:hypothetical protein